MVLSQIFKNILLLLFSHSVMSDSANPWTAASQASLSFTISRSLRKFMSIELMMPSNHLILCHPLLLLPSIFPSIRGFSNELVLLIMRPKYRSFQKHIQSSHYTFEKRDILKSFMPMQIEQEESAVSSVSRRKSISTQEAEPGSYLLQDSQVNSVLGQSCPNSL